MRRDVGYLDFSSVVFSRSVAVCEFGEWILAVLFRDLSGRARTTEVTWSMSGMRLLLLRLGLLRSGRVLCIRGCGGDGVGDAGGNGGAATSLLIGWRTLKDRVDAWRREGSGAGKLVSHEIGRRELHHVVVRGGVDIGEGRVQAGVLVGDVGGF